MAEPSFNFDEEFDSLKGINFSNDNDDFAGIDFNKDSLNLEWDNPPAAEDEAPAAPAGTQDPVLETAPFEPVFPPEGNADAVFPEMTSVNPLDLQVGGLTGLAPSQSVNPLDLQVGGLTGLAPSQMANPQGFSNLSEAYWAGTYAEPKTALPPAAFGLSTADQLTSIADQQQQQPDGFDFASELSRMNAGGPFANGPWLSMHQPGHPQPYPDLPLIPSYFGVPPQLPQGVRYMPPVAGPLDNSYNLYPPSNVKAVPAVSSRKDSSDSRFPSPKVVKMESPLKRRAVDASGQPIELRNDKIPDTKHKRKGKKYTYLDAEEWYGPPHLQPESWGPPDGKGDYLFKYASSGELEPGLFLTQKEMRWFLYGKPNPTEHVRDFKPPKRLRGVPQVEGKQRQGLSCLVGWPATQCNERYPRGNQSTKCRFRDCLMNHTIRQGSPWVILNETGNLTGDAVDPFVNAGYVHLQCLEDKFDMRQLCQDVDFRPDLRHFEYEAKGHFRVDRNDSIPNVKELLHRWWKRRCGPDADRSFEYSLTAALMDAKLRNEPRARKKAARERQEKGSVTNRLTRGDAVKAKRYREYRKAGLLGEDMQPVPNAEELLEEAKLQERKAKAQMKKERRAATTAPPRPAEHVTSSRPLSLLNSPMPDSFYRRQGLQTRQDEEAAAAAAAAAKVAPPSRKRGRDEDEDEVEAAAPTGKKQRQQAPQHLEAPPRPNPRKRGRDEADDEEAGQPASKKPSLMLPGGLPTDSGAAPQDSTIVVQGGAVQPVVVKEEEEEEEEAQDGEDELGPLGEDDDLFGDGLGSPVAFGGGFQCPSSPRTSTSTPSDELERVALGTPVSDEGANAHDEDGGEEDGPRTTSFAADELDRALEQEKCAWADEGAAHDEDAVEEFDQDDDDDDDGDDDHDDDDDDEYEDDI
ncbi:hypothetical protein GGR56DRAFT_258547 [Xylariaceae sp. FL0804]|nr:hypothetical protein GGR56DRAFT_258547 [Xylariaceae sp. FL0804]